MDQAFELNGIGVQVSGQGDHCILMLHGWPDTGRLWDSSATALQARYRCARLTLPGFDTTQAPQACTLAQLTDGLLAVADRLSPDQPVTLLLHDWGCVFGYEFAARHPARVARLIAVDIGDHNRPAYLQALTPKAKWQIFSYQIWLALAWLVGRHLHSGLADRMTRGMARAMRCPTPPERIGWQQNYPYAMAWLGSLGGLKGLARVQPTCPVLFLYGQRKPFQFQSEEWLAQLAQRPGSAVQGFATGHWVMVQDPQGYLAAVQAWLAQHASASPPGADQGLPL